VKNPFSRGPTHKTTEASGLESVPPGDQMIPMEVKRQYERNPIHVYHPTPYNAITILRSKKEPHEWLVCGWYVDTFRDHGVVKGLLYRMVDKDEDKEHVLTELKKVDKEANARFGL
jgi:hypothetical protein